MRTICLVIGGGCCGYLISYGLSQNDLHIYITAAILSICFIGYIFFVYRDVSKQVDETFGKQS